MTASGLTGPLLRSNESTLNSPTLGSRGINSLESDKGVKNSLRHQSGQQIPYQADNLVEFLWGSGDQLHISAYRIVGSQQQISHGEREICKKIKEIGIQSLHHMDILSFTSYVLK